jgi:signal transduction histidine kinase
VKSPSQNPQAKIVRVLLIEDDPDDAHLIREMVADAEASSSAIPTFELVSVDRLSTGLEHLAEPGISAILLDLSLPDGQGLNMLLQVSGQAPGVPILVLTGTNDETLAVTAVQAGAQDYLIKGQVDGNLLVRAIRYAIERKRAEKAFKTLTAKLGQSNRELQDFASVASHDLQEPLRKIQAFGDRLKTKCSEVLTDEGRDYLERMQNAAGRMQTLINDLLTFSRVTTKARPFVPVDLAKVAQEVLADLEARIEETGGRVEVGELPTIDADPMQIRQLLQNLMGNALKFHRQEVAPVVKVHGQFLNSEERRPNANPFCQITVQDNGIGFDEKYLDRIFNVFQRLHGRSEYEGTGVGLAVCRKIAERHGGDITATSTPGQGTTFIVILPVKQSL